MGYEPKPGHVELGMGSLYSFDLKNRKAKKLLDDISIANGLTWNLSLNKMYYIDTLTHKVEQFDYDAQTGDICKYIRRTVLTVTNILLGVPNIIKMLGKRDI